MNIKKQSRTVFAIIAIVFISLFIFSYFYLKPEKEAIKGHIFDEVGIISAQDKIRYENHFDLINRESDLDIKFVFLPTLSSKSIEDTAIEKMDKYRIGSEGGEQRGILFLYIMDQKKLKIEVGYGLEGYLPDAFIGYLIRNQADAFFNSTDPAMGLRLLIRIVHQRIRHASLNRDYDPSILKNRNPTLQLSGGAGATKKVGTYKQSQVFKKDKINSGDKELFSAKSSVESAFNTYISWMASNQYDPNVELFTNSSQQYLNSLPMTPAYFDYLLMYLSGKKFKIIERENLAILIYTDDPMASPLFFKKINKKWHIDISAEVRNSRNYVGGVYTWGLNPDNSDEYTKAFKDIVIKIRGYYRFKDGDNRELPVKQAS